MARNFTNLLSRGEGFWERKAIYEGNSKSKISQAWVLLL